MIDEHGKKVILLVASLASFLVPYTGSSITVALPAIAGQFSVDAVTLGWITSAYIISAAVFILPSGRLADIWGRKKIFLLGVAIFTSASLASAFAPSAGFLIAARFIQGIGGAMLFATSVAIVTQVYGPGERGKVLGITIAAVYAGLSVGPFLGGVLTDHFGWPAIFLLNVPVGLVTIALTLLCVTHEWADAAGERFDTYGTVVYGFMLFCGIFGLLLLPETGGIVWRGVSVCAAAVFIGWEQRCTYPLLNLAIFRENRTFMFSSIAAMINYAATFGVAFLLSLYFQYIRGFPAGTAGLLLIAQPIVQMIFSPFAGRLSDRIEPRVVATAGMAITMLGLSFFIFLDQDTPILFCVLALVVLGFGYALFSSPNTNAIMSSVPLRDLGVASGMVATMRSLGQVLSMAIAMISCSLCIGTVAITPAVYPALQTSIRYAFAAFTGICCIGIGASIVRGTIHHT